MPVMVCMNGLEAVIQRLWLAYFLLFISENSSGVVPGERNELASIVRQAQGVSNETSDSMRCSTRGERRMVADGSRYGAGNKGG
jgi:hypothetical protein